MSDGFLLAGSVSVNPYDDNGVLTTEIDLGNTTSFTYSQESGTSIQRIGRGIDNYGKVISEYVTPGTSSISITSDSLNRKNLAFLFLGTDSDITDGFRIEGNTKNSVRCQITLTGKNLDNNHNCTFVALDVALVPNGDLDFLVKDQYATLQLKGTLTTPTGQDFSFTYQETTT